MLVTDAMTIARRHLQDLELPYRYDDGDVLAGLNAGLALAYRVRPDLFIGSYTGVPPQVPAPVGELPLDGIMVNALADYAAGWCELKDDEFVTGPRAELLHKMFLNALGGGG